MLVRNGGKSILGIKIFDRDLIKDDLGGEVDIHLLKEGLLIPQGKPKEKEFDLICNNTKSGTIKIEY